MVLPHLRYISIAGCTLVAAGAVATYFLRRKPKTASELERERREYLNLHGRILDGTILDFQEITEGEEAEAAVVQLLLYSYEIGGVQYEAAQDITDLRQYVNVQECKLGFPASVRYDPHHPQNSMVVSEQWSGLRNITVHPKVAHVVRPSPRDPRRADNLFARSN